MLLFCPHKKVSNEAEKMLFLKNSYTEKHRGTQSFTEKNTKADSDRKVHRVAKQPFIRPLKKGVKKTG